jgi:hypothetical protein
MGKNSRSSVRWHRIRQMKKKARDKAKRNAGRK